MKKLKKNDEGTGKMKPKKPAFMNWFAPLLLIVALMLYLGKDQYQTVTKVSLDRFWFLIASGRVEEKEINGKTAKIGLRLGTPNEPIRWFYAEFPEMGEKTFARIQQLGSKKTTQEIQDREFLAEIKSKETLPISAYLLRNDNTDFNVLGDRELFFVDAIRKNEPQYLRIRPLGGEKLQLGAIASELHALNVPVETFSLLPGEGLVYSESNSLLSYFLLQMLVPFFLIGFIFYFFLIRPARSSGGGGGVLSFGRSRAVLYTKENRTNVTFADVAGIEEAKEEVSEVIAFLKNPAQFSRLGGRIPRGVLLVGPPGAGKTLLAKAIAGEAEVPFFSISGSDFVEMFVGVGASRVRDLFKQAKDSSPCIIFLDEIDAVGRKRGSGMGGGHDEREQTLNAILVEMDGFDTDTGIIVCAATNRPDVLDPALLRPGRFDREIAIDLPDYKGREEILKVHARKVKLSPKVDLAILARSTPTFSGADLAALINEAAIIAVMKKKDSIEMDDLEEARDKIKFGRQKKSRVMQEDDRRVTAFHEGGHALVSCLLPDAEKLHKVTIIPRGMALGLTMQLPDRDRYTMGRRRVLASICVSYGGRLAEKLFCNDISTGAENDIKHATQMARYMVTEWGMSDKIGPINYSEREGSVFLGQEFGSDKFHSPDTAREIDEEVRKILDECYKRAEELLAAHRPELERIADALLKFETLSGAEVEELIAGKKIEDLRPMEPPSTPSPEASAATEAKPAKRREDSEPGRLRGDEGFAPAS